MSKYYCNYCNYDAKVKGNYDKHLKTKKHQTRLSESQPLVNQKSTFSQPLVNQKSTFSQPLVNLHDSDNQSKIQCKYCKKDFKFKQSMYKHIKYVCKRNKDEDFKELARLLNEQNKQLGLKDNDMEKQLVSKDKEMEKQLVLKDRQMEMMQKQIDKLTNKLQIQNINQGVVVNNTMNIQLLNHQDTDYSHLTPKDYMSCIHDCNKCVKTLIEKVHFNADKPENMNIYLSNIKGKYLMIYKDNAWQIQDKKVQVDDLYDYNEFVLENWYDEYIEKYPSIIESFQMYLKNRGSDMTLNKIKEEILVMLYNKRKTISVDGQIV